ncbi:hypothetical protein B0H15DRAFT_947598 [Mycena belliarum]|uniref:Uncharacterized protein n=1 Tax=Mycena belliarum TaxID=1033014 RepID=A0AAD6XT61_9AGAR|nr:hypothetical protein B0H15DRAFT_947598 [Mycena belliae]
MKAREAREAQEVQEAREAWEAVHTASSARHVPANCEHDAGTRAYSATPPSHVFLPPSLAVSARDANAEDDPEAQCGNATSHTPCSARPCRRAAHPVGCVPALSVPRAWDAKPQLGDVELTSDASCAGDDEDQDVPRTRTQNRPRLRGSVRERGSQLPPRPRRRRPSCRATSRRRAARVTVRYYRLSYALTNPTPHASLHTSRPPSRNAAARELGLAASRSELGFALEAPKPSASSPVARSARSHWRAKDGPARNRRPGRKSRGRSVRAVCPSASHRQYAGSSPRRRAASSLRALSTAARSLGARAVRDGTSGIPHHHLRYATLHYTRAAAGLYSDVAPRSPPSTRSSAHSRPLRRPHIAPPAGIPSRSGRPDCVRVHSRPRQVGPLVPPSPPPSPPRTQRRPRIRGPTCERGSDRGPHPERVDRPPPPSPASRFKGARAPSLLAASRQTRRPRPKTCAAVKAKFARGAAIPSPRRSSLGARQAACCRASPAAHLPPSTSALAAQLSSPPARRLCSDAPHPAPPRANRSSPNAGLDAGVGVSGRPASPTINEREVRSLRSPRDAAAGVSKSQRAGAVLVLAHGGVERAVLAERVPRTPQTRMDVEPWICERHPRSRASPLQIAARNHGLRSALQRAGHPSPSDSGARRGPDLRAASRLATSPETPRPPRFPRARAGPLRLASARRSFRRLGRHSRAAHPCAANRVVLLRARASPLGRGSRVFPARRAESARAVVLQREVSACNERTRFGALAALCSARDSRRIAARGGARTRTGRFGSSSAAQVLRRGAGERAALPEHADSSGTSDQGSFDLMRARRATDVPEPARRVEWGALRVGCAHGSQVKSDRARCPQSSRYKDAIRDGTRAKRGSGHGIPVRDLPRYRSPAPSDLSPGSRLERDLGGRTPARKVPRADF